MGDGYRLCSIFGADLRASLAYDESPAESIPVLHQRLEPALLKCQNWRSRLAREQLKRPTLHALNLCGGSLAIRGSSI